MKTYTSNNNKFLVNHMEHAKEMLKGFRDSWMLVKPIAYVINSPGVLTRVVQCTVVNGALFIGSILFFNKIADPFLHRLGGVFGINIEPIITMLYYMFWLYPIYIVSFVLTTFWVQDIFDAAFKHFYKGKAMPHYKSLSPAEFVSYLVKRIVMIGIFIIQCILFSYLPFGIGSIIEMMHYSLLCSYYCFEYITIALNINLAESVIMFEHNWSYFLGFGASFTAMMLKFPGIMNSGVFCFLFPFLVLTGVPADVVLKKNSGTSLPFFTIALKLTTKIFALIV